MFEIVWRVMIAFGFVAIGGHLVATRELAKSDPHSRGLGWFGQGPSSPLGKKAYFIKRVFTLLALAAVAIAIVLGGPASP